MAKATKRIPCLVPHCKRTRPDIGDGVEVIQHGWLAFDAWLCSIHWAMVPDSLRVLFQAAKMALKRSREPRDVLIVHELWHQCQQAAIEQAAGIGGAGRV